MNKYIKQLVESFFDDIEDDITNNDSALYDENIKYIIKATKKSKYENKTNLSKVNADNLSAYLTYIKVAEAYMDYILTTYSYNKEFLYYINFSNRYDEINVLLDSLIMPSLKIKYVDTNHIIYCNNMIYHKDLSSNIKYLQLDMHTLDLFYNLTKNDIYVSEIWYYDLSRSVSTLKIVINDSTRFNTASVLKYITSNKFPLIMLSSGKPCNFKQCIITDNPSNYVYTHKVRVNTYTEKFINQLLEFVNAAYPKLPVTIDNSLLANL